MPPTSFFMPVACMSAVCRRTGTYRYRSAKRSPARDHTILVELDAIKEWEPKGERKGRKKGRQQQIPEISHTLLREAYCLNKPKRDVHGNETFYFF